MDGRDDLQRHLDRLSERDLQRVPSGRQHTIGELWAHERGRLMPLPPRRFDAAATRSAKVTKRSWVQFGTNFYSVPVHLVDRTVTMRVYAEEVVVHDGHGEVARHRRSYGQGQMVLELEHYLPLLQRKHRGLDRAVPVRQWLGRVSPCWRQLLAVLRERAGEIDGSKQFIAALQLCGHHGVPATTAAVERTLLAPEVSLPVIRFHLGLRQDEARPPCRTIAYHGPAVVQGPAAAYMGVLRG